MTVSAVGAPSSCSTLPPAPADGGGALGAPGGPTDPATKGGGNASPIQAPTEGGGDGAPTQTTTQGGGPGSLEAILQELTTVLQQLAALVQQMAPVGAPSPGVDGGGGTDAQAGAAACTMPDCPMHAGAAPASASIDPEIGENPATEGGGGGVGDATNGAAHTAENCTMPNCPMHQAAAGAAATQPG